MTKTVKIPRRHRRYLGHYFTLPGLRLLDRFPQLTIFSAKPGEFFLDNYGGWWLRTDPQRHFTNENASTLTTFCAVAFDGDFADYPCSDPNFVKLSDSPF